MTARGRSKKASSVRASRSISRRDTLSRRPKVIWKYCAKGLHGLLCSYSYVVISLVMMVEKKRRPFVIGFYKSVTDKIHRLIRRLLFVPLTFSSLPLPLPLPHPLPLPLPLPLPFLFLSFFSPLALWISEEAAKNGKDVLLSSRQITFHIKHDHDPSSPSHQQLRSYESESAEVAYLLYSYLRWLFGGG